jgi:hypothetical protein
MSRLENHTPKRVVTLWRIHPDLLNEVQSESTPDELAIPTRLAQAADLSFAARGLIITLLHLATLNGVSLVSAVHVSGMGGFGIDKARSLIRELTLHGHLIPADRQMDKSGYVYLLQSPTTYYKIGKTNAPNNRLKTFNVKLPFEVEYAALIETSDMHRLEKELHERYETKRVKGTEWFALDADDVTYIKSLDGGS